MSTLIVEKSDPAQSSSGTSYTTLCEADGKLKCNCPGWANWYTKKKGLGRTCKHIDAILSKHKLTAVERGEFRYAPDAAGLAAQGWRWPVATGLFQTAKKTKKLLRPAVTVTPKKTKKLLRPAVTVTPQPKSKFTTIPEVDAFPAKKRFNVIPEVDDDEDTAVFVKPMLASQMPDVADHKIDTILAALSRYNARDWAMEEKFDGHRVIVTVNEGRVKAWSRPQTGKDALVRELPDHLMAEFTVLPTGTYDGELMIAGGRSYNVTDGKFAGQEIFVVFDILSLLGLPTIGETYDARRAYLTEIFKTHDTLKSVKLAASFEPSAAAVKAIWARDGEGAILKRRASNYQPGARSQDYIKVKGLIPFLMTVTGYKADKSGPYSVVLLKGDDGSKAKVKTLDASAYAAFAADPDSFIGRKLWIECQERTPEGSYRHPRYDRFEDE